MKRFVLKAMISSLIVMSAFAIGAFAKGWTTDGSDWFYYDSDEDIVKDVIRSSGDDRFYLDENGYMVRDYLLEDYNGATYYFDETGKMVTSTWVAVDITQVQNGMDNPPSIYLYYFGTNGKAFKSTSTNPVKKTIDGKKYMFNENGQMLSGWINEQGERYNVFDTEEDPFVGYCYYAGDETDGVLREGWSAYEDGSVDDKYYTKQVLWFYFKPGNCKKECSDISDDYKMRVINGKKYGFDVNGVMIQGWDSDTVENYGTTKKYFSEDSREGERGRLYKKEWIFAVPSKEQCDTNASDIHGDEKDATNDHDEEISRWFYSLGSGDVVKSAMRRINGQYYVFNQVGILKSGLCIVDKNNKYLDCIDTEKTDGKDFIISRRYISEDSYSANVPNKLFDDKTQKIYYFERDEQAKDFGLRKSNAVKIPFADDDYTFVSKNTGENEGLKSRKYYQGGILLQANSSLGLGLVLVGFSSNSNALGINRKPEYNDSKSGYSHLDVNYDNYTDYIVDDSVAFCKEHSAYPVYHVVDANGTKLKKSNAYAKDKAGHYWLIGGNNALVKIFDVPIKYVKSKNIWYFKSEALVGTKIKTTWIPFADSPGLASRSEIELEPKDIYGKQCYLNRNEPEDKDRTYESYVDDTFATNFRFVDK